MKAATNSRTPSADPVDLLGQFSADTLREKIAELDSRRRALVVLLRAAHARERRLRRSAAVGGAAEKGGQHAP